MYNYSCMCIPDIKCYQILTDLKPAIKPKPVHLSSCHRKVTVSKPVDKSKDCVTRCPSNRKHSTKFPDDKISQIYSTAHRIQHNENCNL